MTNDQTKLEKKSKRLTNRQPPIAQLVERRTVEKLISLGPRVGGWHKLFCNNSFRNLIYCSKSKLKTKLVNQNRLRYLYFKT